MYESEINGIKNNPLQLELLYRTAVNQGRSPEFAHALESCFQNEPDHVLLAAWHHRLARPDEMVIETQVSDWRLAIPLALASGAVVGLLSMVTNAINGSAPPTLRYWSLIALFFVLIYLKLKHKDNWKISVILFAFSGIVVGWTLVSENRIDLFNYFTEQLHYTTLVILCLPILAWAIAGISILGNRSRVLDRFAFLRKSLEIFVTGGVFGAGLFVFTFVAFQLFNAISVTIPQWLMDFMVGFIVGVAPVIAVAFIYNPLIRPAEQVSDHGIGKLIVTLMRVLLPVTFLVLVIYVGFIPFNFWEPFQNRDVLTVYNVMLFAVVALLIGCTPLTLQELPRKWLKYIRWGIIGVASLAVLVSIYAMSAVVYRTIDGGLTINRLTIIGWNVVNIAILIILIIKQLIKPEKWIEALHQAFSVGMILYPAWALFILLFGPLLF